MKTILMLAVIALFSQNTFAGKQTSTEINVKSVTFEKTGLDAPEAFGLLVVGTYGKKNKPAKCSVITSIQYTDVVENVNCDSLDYKCSLWNLRASEGFAVADVYGDVNGAGSQKFAELELGIIGENNSVNLKDAKLKALWVEDKYTWAEKLQGMKDKSYCAISSVKPVY